MGGRKPKPNALKALDGNPGKRPILEEPPVALGVPDAPTHLSDMARAEWDRITVELEAAGLLAQVDRAALAAYCVAWGRWVDAEAKVAELGTVIKAPSGYPIQSPYLAIANKAMEQMKVFLVEFGMTPSSRARIAAPPKPQKQANPFVKLA
jgi:P27 family predicted phage terminase small subunit